MVEGKTPSKSLFRSFLGVKETASGVAPDDNIVIGAPVGIPLALL